MKEELKLMFIDPGLRRELSFVTLTLDPAPQARTTNLNNYNLCKKINAQPT